MRVDFELLIFRLSCVRIKGLTSFHVWLLAFCDEKFLVRSSCGNVVANPEVLFDAIDQKTWLLYFHVCLADFI